MYSQKVLKALKAKNIKPGDYINVRKNGKVYSGILMPKTEFGDPDALVLKMDNGYNIGIKFEKGVLIEKSDKKVVKKVSKIPSIAFDPKKPVVSILTCGGTIASKIDYETGAVYPAFRPEEIVGIVPELKDIANIKSKYVMNLLSSNMHPLHWPLIAKEVKKAIDDSYGVVITHGTDTMHYTSAALSFMIQNLPVPVVLTGAQRSSDRGSSDSHMNLIASVIAAKSDIAEVMICMHGSSNDDFCYLHQGTKVRKMHTSRRDALKSINVEPYAKIWYRTGDVQYIRNDFRKRGEKKDMIFDPRINPNVGLVFVHPGIKPEFIDNLAKFYDGVVLAVMGLGHVPTNKNDKLVNPIIENVSNLVNSGIPVVVAPQTIYGRLNLNVYDYGRKLEEAGVIGNYCDWTPETALVKLMWVLGHTKDMKKIKEMMLKNYVGEISEISEMI